MPTLTPEQRRRVNDMLAMTPPPALEDLATVAVLSQDEAKAAEEKTATTEEERDAQRKSKERAIIALLALIAAVVLMFTFKQPAFLFGPAKHKDTAGQPDKPSPTTSASASAGGKNGDGKKGGKERGGAKPSISAAPDGTANPASPKPGENGTKTDTVPSDGKEKLWTNPTQGELDYVSDTLNIARLPATEWYEPHWAWLPDPNHRGQWIANTELVQGPHVLCGFKTDALKAKVLVNQNGQGGVPAGMSRWNVGYGDAKGHYCQVVRRIMTAAELADIQQRFWEAANLQN